jgi:hypothetical protein
LDRGMRCSEIQEACHAGGKQFQYQKVPRASVIGLKEQLERKLNNPGLAVSFCAPGIAG